MILQQSVVFHRRLKTRLFTVATGVNPAGDAGNTSPGSYILVGGRQWEYPHQYYYIRSDIADQY